MKKTIKKNVFVNFSNVRWFSVKIKVSEWVESNFFSLAVSDENLLAEMYI